MALGGRRKYAKKFDYLETSNAKSWLEKSLGKRVYNLLWRKLLELKFYEFSDNISAAWIATRIKRVGNSRESIFRERLGYISGGSKTLVDALVEVIQNNGGLLKLEMPVNNIKKESQQFALTTENGDLSYYDHVIVTVPTPLVPKIIPSLSSEEKLKLKSIRNIGVVCVVIEIKKSVSDKFWLNVVDDDFDVPGVIEFSNLRDMENTVVYMPYYMPTSNPKFNDSSEVFISKCKAYCKKINPSITDDDFLHYHVGRLRYSQPVCEPGFAKKLPEIQTSITNLQVADTSYYYPEDRGFNESIKMGRQMAQNI